MHDPLAVEQLATLGGALGLRPGSRPLDPGCGSGELLCTWAGDHGVTGTGVDISAVFLAWARSRAAELACPTGSPVGRRRHRPCDGAPVDAAVCTGATWIGGGLPGTVELLARGTVPGGLIRVGHPYWRRAPKDRETAVGCGADGIGDLLTLPELLASFGPLGYDLVEMVLTGPAGWDRYVAARWLTTRRRLDAHPDDEPAPATRAELDTAAVQHVRYHQREYLGRGAFTLMAR